MWSKNDNRHTNHGLDKWNYYLSIGISVVDYVLDQESQRNCGRH